MQLGGLVGGMEGGLDGTLEGALEGATSWDTLSGQKLKVLKKPISFPMRRVMPQLFQINQNKT